MLKTIGWKNYPTFPGFYALSNIVISLKFKKIVNTDPVVDIFV